MAPRVLVLALAISMTVLLPSPASAQITTPCPPSMIATFTPCMNFFTNSSLNGTAPTADCCNSLKSLMSNGMDCLCLIATASVPFQLPINRNPVISLPRACNMPGMPLQCKASGAPVPAPGPVANGPALSPNIAPSPSTKGLPEPLSPRLPPEADTSPPPPPPPTTTTGGAPAGNSGSRAGVTPSAAQPPCTVSLTMVLVAVSGAVVALKHY